MTDTATTTRAAPWRGVKRTENPRDAWVHVRVTRAELARYEAAAAQTGETVSEFFRRSADGKARPRAAANLVDRAALAHVLAALGRYASNLNQIARVANSSGEIDRWGGLKDAIAATHEMRDALMAALGRDH